jgi:hypothetical protein
MAVLQYQLKIPWCGGQSTGLGNIVEINAGKKGDNDV